MGSLLPWMGNCRPQGSGLPKHPASGAFGSVGPHFTSGVVGGNVFPPYRGVSHHMEAIISGVMFSSRAITSCTVASRSKALEMQLVEWA